jgi:predicted nucleic acid-binding protein
MKKIYFDSGALIKIYIRESYSIQVIAKVKTVPQIPYSHLHDLEIRNALRAQAGRNLITEAQCRDAFLLIDEDISSNRLFLFNLNWKSVYEKAEELSQHYTKKTLCRSLDILHVALAHALSCNKFVTGDKRQALLAEDSGLTLDFVGKRG